MKKIESKKEKLVKDTLNKYPAYTDKQIATKLKIHRDTVAKYRKETALSHDAQFVNIVAGRFISAFETSSDYWYNQITELEELKNNKKTIFKLGKDGKTKYPTEVDLEPMDILAICKQQADLQSKILFLASQGEVKEVIKVMRNGKFTVST